MRKNPTHSSESPQKAPALLLPNHLPALLFAALASAMAPLSLFGAQTAGTWNVDANGSWSNAANWQITIAGTSPYPNGQQDTALLGSKITANRQITLDQAATTIANITFNNANSYDIEPGVGGSANVLNLNGGTGQFVQAGTGSDTMGANISEQVAATMFDGAGTGNITVNGDIQFGPHPVTFQGTNYTVFLTSTNNTGTKTMTIAAGIVHLQGKGVLLPTGGTTVKSGGTLQLNTTTGTVINGLTLAGGTLRQMANNSNTLGSLTQTAASTITLLSGGSSTGKLNFSNTSFAPTGLLTINNWTGPGYGPGTGNEIFFASSMHGTTFTGSQVQFAGFAGGAYVLSTGELVPAPEPGTCLNALLLLGLISGHLLKRKRSVKA